MKNMMINQFHHGKYQNIIYFYNFIFLIFKILILIYFDEYYYYYYYRSIPNTKLEVFPKISLEPIQLLANIYKK